MPQSGKKSRENNSTPFGKTIIFKHQGISLIVSKSAKSQGNLFSLHTNPMKGVKDFNLETEILVVCKENQASVKKDFCLILVT